MRIFDVAGMGPVGRVVTTALTTAGFEYRTIDLVDGPTVDVVGDATEREVLREAGIMDAGTVVLALPDSTAAIFSTFAIRELTPWIELITQANEHESVSKLYRAGADYLLSLAAVSERMLASIVHRRGDRPSGYATETHPDGGPRCSRRIAR